MTRANRERKKTKKINIMKCMYDLPRFDSHFEPQVKCITYNDSVVKCHCKRSHCILAVQLHNRYFRAKKSCRESHAAIQFHKLVVDRLEDIVKEEDDRRSTFDRRFDTEQSIF